MKQKRLLFFTWPQESHIKPLIGLIKYLENRNFDIYCVTTKKYENLIAQTKAKFVEYPYDPYSIIFQDYYKKVEEEKNEALKNFDFFSYRKLMFKLGTISCYGEEENYINRALEIIKEIQPNYIFRDAVERVISNIAFDKKIPCIGYITNNVNYFELFDSNPLYYYPHVLFTNPVLSKNFFTDQEYCQIKQFLLDISKEVACELGQKRIKLCIQNDPHENKNIIFSSALLQHDLISSKREYIIASPDECRFKIENVDKEIEDFFDTDKKIIYLATGSIITKSDDYYLKYIKVLLKHNFKLIISWKKERTELKEILGEFFEHPDLLIRQYQPQQYILSKANLFITTGGFNSVIEAIYYGIPMLVDSFSGEQNLNALLVEELGIGYYTNKIRKKHITTGEMIIELLDNPIYKQNILLLSDKLKKENAIQSYEKIEEWLN